MRKRIASIVLSLCLCLTLLPTAAFAAQSETTDTTEQTQSTDGVKCGDFTVSGEGVLDTDYSYADGALTIKTNKAVTIKNTNPDVATTDHIVVDSAKGANIALAGVNIDVSLIEFMTAVLCSEKCGGTVTVILEDSTKNILKSGKYSVGLQTAENAKTVINGAGNLEAYGGEDGAGIGGGSNSAGGTIEINGGIITATGGQFAAGIGGSGGGAGGTITINGGRVTASGGLAGAGIGGSGGGAGGTITIKGGSVTASGGNNGAGIGGGSNSAGGTVVITGGNIQATGGDTTAEAAPEDIGHGIFSTDSGTLKDGSGNNVSKYTLTLSTEDISSAHLIQGLGNYGLNGVTALDTNKVYLYLPESAPTAVSIGNTIYCRCSSNDYKQATLNYAVEDNTIKVSCNGCQETMGIVSIAASGGTYCGSAYMATATGTDAMANGEYQINYAVKGGNALDGAPKNTGEYTASLTLGGATISTDFTINPKTVANPTVEVDKTADQTYTGEQIKPTVIVKDGNDVISENEYEVTYSDNINVGNATITISDKAGGNYTVSGTGSFTITQKSLTASMISVTGEFTYDGDEKSPAVTVTDGEKTLVLDTDYELSGDKTGTAAKTYTLTVSGKGNYGGSVEKNWTIGNATLTNISVEQDGKLTYDGTPQTPQVKTTAPDGLTVSFTYCTTENGTYGEMPTFTNAGTYRVYYKADAANYETDSGSLTVTIAQKTITPTVTLANSTFDYDGTTKMPTVTVKDGETTVPASEYEVAYSNNTNAGKATVTVTDKTGGNYAIGTAGTTFDIGKAKLPAPTFGTISESGKKLSDVSVTNTESDATFAWEKGNDTEVKRGESYAWTLTPKDTDNYDTLTGSYTPWPAPSSSGSSSNTTSTTVKNPDGSTTVTKTDKKTGTVTETTTTPNGTTSITVTDKNGNSTTTVSVSKKDAQSGETVALPVDEVTAAGKSEDAQEITVEVPSGGATVEIPVKNPTPGTVIVIVDKNGNETVVPTTKQTENGVTVTLTEDATIKVIENSKDFSDVKFSDYFGKAVDWASSRGITGGNSATTFGPHDSCIRAQLVTFLWRAAGQPEAENESGMSDVATNSYYTDAVAWAFENGIVGGYGNGLFGSDDTITREQMAVILYRFAQHTGIDTTQGGMAVREYKDYESISDYAVTAIQWAVNAGVMQGYDGNLMPGQPCTRAQIVTMLYRLLGE